MSGWESQHSTDQARSHPEPDTLHDLWKLTALPRSEFDATYLDLWSRATACLETHPSDENDAFNTTLMTLTRAAMRVRQSQILPRRIPTEEATRVSELMTFVLALSVALHCLRAKWRSADVAQSLHEWGLDTLVCAASRRWIRDEPVAYEELRRFCAAGTDSELRGLIELAETRLIALREPTSAVPLPRIDSAQTAVPARKAKGWRFLEWLRSELEADRLSVNESDSLVHTLPGGETFIVVPALFQQFAQIESTPAKRVQNQVARLGLHRVVEGHNLFNANVNGRTVRGLILGRGAGLWAHPPAPNPVLRMRPVRTS